jgi:hypothetical protein
MLIKFIKFDQFDYYFYPYSLKTLGIVPAGAFSDSFRVTDKQLFMLAVVKHGIEFKEL